MKVAWLGPANSTHSLKWVNSLAAAGIEVSLISLHDPSEPLSSNVRFHRLKGQPPLAYVTSARQLRKLLAEIKPDLLHSNYASGYGTLGRLSGFHPHLVSVWGDDVYRYPYRSLLHRWNLTATLRSADRIASTSKAMASQAELFWRPPQPITITPFGVDTELFQPAPNPSPQQDRFHVGIFKHLDLDYGIDTALRAFAEFRRRTPEISSRLTIAGTGRHEAEIRALISDLKLSDAVELTGRLSQHEVARRLRSVDAALNLSRYESYGVAILEAAASGVPVIATDVGGVKEVLSSAHGFLVPLEQAEKKTVDHLLHLASNRASGQKLGIAGRENVVRNFSDRLCLSQMLQLYKTIDVTALNVLSFVPAFRKTLGRKVSLIFMGAVSTGALWFASEAAFLLVFQAFLVSIGLVNINDASIRTFPELIPWAVPILVAFGFLRLITGFLRSFLISYAQYEFLVEKRAQVFEKGLLSAHIIPPGRIATLFNDVTSNAAFLVNQMSSLLSSALMFVLLACAALWTAPQEMLVGGLVLFLLTLPMRIFSARISRDGEGALREWGRLNERLMTGLRNHFFLTVYRQTHGEVIWGRNALQKYLRHYRSYAGSLSIASVYPTFAGIMTIAVVSTFSQKHFGTEPASLLSFLYLFIRLAQVGSEMLTVSSNVRFSMHSFVDLQRFLDKGRISSPPVQKAVPPDLLGPIRTVEMTNLSFSYPGQNSLWTSLNLKAHEGDRIAVMGPSGHGKSTLLQLLLGLLSPVDGHLAINDRSPERVDESLFDQVGYVGPEPFLIQASVKENLLYGHPAPEKVTESQIAQALEDAAVQDVIESLPLGLDSVIGGELPLSTGQRQRLSIARALLRAPRLLIFDEGTANIDRSTEARIFERLKARTENSIFFFVTHNPDLAVHATITLDLAKERGGR